MKKYILAVALVAALSLGTSAAFAQLSPAAPSVPSAPKVEAPKAMTPKVDAQKAMTPKVVAPKVEEKKEAKPASEAQMKQRNKMKECGAKWQAIKKAGTTNGQTWKTYSPKCLKGEA